MIRITSLAIGKGNCDGTVGNRGEDVGKRVLPHSRAQALIPRRSRRVRPCPGAVARGWSRSGRKAS